MGSGDFDSLWTMKVLSSSLFFLVIACWTAQPTSCKPMNSWFGEPMGNNAWLEFIQNFLSTFGFNLNNQTNMTTSGTTNMTTSSTNAGTTHAENEDYCALGAGHTMCKFKGPSSSCTQKTKSRGMTQASKEAVLAKHNELRRKVAKGEEAGQPGASNMRELVWDEELEAIAQRWADQCTLGHYKDPKEPFKNSRALLDGTPAGQNLAWSQASAQLNEDQLMEQNVGAVQGWYDEVSKFNSAGIDAFSFSRATGHYTQLVWAETDRLGCGTVHYKDDSNGVLTNFVVCNYAVAGNMQGGSMYAQGSACTSCPASTTCVDSLCQSA